MLRSSRFPSRGLALLIPLLFASQAGADGADFMAADGQPNAVAVRPAPRQVFLRLLWGQIPGRKVPRPMADIRPADAPIAAPIAAVNVIGVHPVPRPTHWRGQVVGYGVRVEWMAKVRFEHRDRLAGCHGRNALPVEAVEAAAINARPIEAARCRQVKWRTRTTVHNDGVILRLTALPVLAVNAARPHVVINFGPYHNVRLTLDQIAALNSYVNVPGVLPVEPPNRISAVGLERRHGCAAGFIEGLWISSAREQGGYSGLWYNVAGTLGGRIQGVYVRDGLAYGMATDLDGDIIAFTEGRHGGGEFGLVGRDLLGRPLGDLYGHTGPDFFHGAWATDCR